MKNILIIAISAFFWLFSLTLVDNWLNPTSPTLGYFSNPIGGSMTYASSTVGTSTATKILSKNQSRDYAAICNWHASSGVAIIYLKNTGTSTIAGVSRDQNNGYPLAALSPTGANNAQACYVINQNNPWTGEVWAVFFSSTTGQINTQEK